jgi:septum formation protein
MSFIYLASQSPRRRTLLEQIGVAFRPLEVEINEDWDGTEQAADYVCRLAREKSQHGWDSLPPAEQVPVLGADTSVVLDGVILGKPEDQAHAVEMLRQLSGRTHQVFTGIAVSDGETRSLLSISHVSFRVLDQAECLAYWQTGEPQGKAGGYAIQGRAAAFIQRLEGSYSGVMGLPLYETAQLLALYKTA